MTRYWVTARSRARRAGEWRGRARGKDDGACAKGEVDDASVTSSFVQGGRRGRAAAWARGRQCGRGGGCVLVRERDWSEIVGGDGGASGEADERARHRTLGRPLRKNDF